MNEEGKNAKSTLDKDETFVWMNLISHQMAINRVRASAWVYFTNCTISLLRKGRSPFWSWVKTLFAYEATIWIKVKWKFKATQDDKSFDVQQRKAERNFRVHVLPGAIRCLSREPRRRPMPRRMLESHKQKSSSESINKTTNNFD